MNNPLIQISIVVVSTAFLTTSLTQQWLSKFFKGSRVVYIQGLLSVSPYVCFSTYRAFSSSYVPDEANFIHIAFQNGLQNMNEQNLLFSPNLEGFGGVFWTLVGLVISISKFSATGSDIATLDSMQFRQYLFDFDYQQTLFVIIAIRIMALLMVSLWLYLFAVFSIKNGDVLHRLMPAVAVCLPIFWWSGKIASPELFASACIGISVIFVIQKKIFLSSIFAGIAVGFKVSAAPMALFAAMLILWVLSNTKSTWSWKVKSFLISISTMLTSWLICNLFILKDFEKFWAYAKRVTPASVPDLNFGLVKSIIKAWNTPLLMTWDFVNTSGFFFWSGGALFLVLIATYLIINKSYVVAIAYFSCLILGTVLIIIGGAQEFPWYYFPAIFSGFSLLNIGKIKRSIYSRFSKLSLAGIMLLLAVAGTSNSMLEFNSQLLHESDLEALKNSQPCLETAVDSLNSNQHIFDLAVMGHHAVTNRILPDAWDAFLWQQQSTDSTSYWIVGSLSENYVSLNTSAKKVEVYKECGKFKIIEMANTN